MQSSIARLICLGLLVTPPAHAVEAQELAGSFDQLRVLVKVGDTVRVTDRSGHAVRGAVSELSPSSLALRVAGSRRTFLEADIESITQRRPDSLANGATWGFVAGAGLGLLAGITLLSEYDGSGAAVIPMLALAYGGIGAGTGAGLDAMRSSERPIYASRRAASKVRLRPILAGGRKGVVASLTWGSGS